MASGSILQLVYVSSASRGFREEDLADILRASRRNNPAAGVTGALLHADGNFMQVLEGPPEAVEAVYARVEQDPRHSGVLVLLRHLVDRRSFGDWAMGLLHESDVPEADRAAVRSLHSFTPDSPDRVRRLLATFGRTASGGARRAA